MIVWAMRYLKKFKLTGWDKLLLTVYLICCVLIAYIAADFIIHAGPDYRGKITDSEGTIVWCTDLNKGWSPRNGICAK